MFISVLLPLPELPMIATKSPRSMLSDTPRSARHADRADRVGLADVADIDHGAGRLAAAIAPHVPVGEHGMRVCSGGRHVFARCGGRGARHERLAARGAHAKG